MGLWARVRQLASRPERRLLADLGGAYHEELRLARQLRLHGERVPYPSLAAQLAALADQEEAHAALLREQIARLGGAVDPAGMGSTRGGRNYWERLTVDLQDLRAKSKRYRELADHWDIENAEAAGLFARISDEDIAMGRILVDLIARSDPHAQD